MNNVNWGIIIDDIVKKMINSNIEHRFWKACGMGDLQLINVLAEEGANNFNSGLCAACYCCRPNVIDRLVELGANNFDGAMIESCYYADLDIIMKMVEFGANDVYDALDKLIYFETHFINNRIY